MSQSIGREFRKTGVCPRSESLLAFVEGEGFPTDRSAIAAHLDDCDFCSTEVEIYRRFPQDREPAPTPRIPRALLEFATTLLGGKNKDASRAVNKGGDREIDLDQACGAF